MHAIVPIGGNMRVLKLQAIVQEKMGVFFHAPRAPLTMTMNMDECFAAGATLFSHLVHNGRIALDERLLAEFVDDSLVTEELKRQLRHPTNCVYSVEIASYASVTVPQTEASPAIDAMREPVLKELEGIRQREQEMANMHRLCSEAELLMMACDALKASAWVPTSEDEAVVAFKKQCEERGIYCWEKDGRFEREDMITKNTRWWARMKGEMVGGCKELMELAASYTPLHDKALKKIRFTSRVKLVYEEMVCTYHELKEWKARFESASKRVADATDLGLYQILKRGAKKNAHWLVSLIKVDCRVFGTDTALLCLSPFDCSVFHGIPSIEQGSRTIWKGPSFLLSEVHYFFISLIREL